ncbi:L-cystine transport system permease protein TcyL [Philodulcilactobacillus myokoensis]|uniref:L-cystine transport system permease protein TcyL n=1 Tax=Philodulcilactobacillus myokoensis TaxID=2929573 RepID=A0A9W6B0A8_9LACO|nr:amino acid ABC transporter permease [Philodulcilactobacillus myokoensis]GLB46308.1 L-cystine transport system permease protein TcyL [Philodulcilactobacillus myokoensis]
MSFTGTVKALLAGLPSTLFILIVSFILSSIIGLFVAWLASQSDKFSRGLAKVYTGLSRGTPPLLMLLLAYYELPKILQFVGINANDWSKYFFAIFGLSVGFGGYMGEVFRSAFESVDRSQFEAAYSVGMERKDVFKEIILPQLFVIALPNIQNMFLSFLKATSLVYVIGIADMYQDATSLANVHQGVFQLQIFLVLGVIYWLITVVFDYLFKLYIKKHDYI